MLAAHSQGANERVQGHHIQLAGRTDFGEATASAAAKGKCQQQVPLDVEPHQVPEHHQITAHVTWGSENL